MNGMVQKMSRRDLTPQQRQEQKDQLGANGDQFLKALEVLNESMKVPPTSPSPTRYAYYIIQRLIEDAYAMSAYQKNRIDEIYSALVDGSFRQAVAPYAQSNAAAKALATLERMAINGIPLPVY